MCPSTHDADKLWVMSVVLASLVEGVKDGNMTPFWKDLCSQTINLL